MNLNTLMSLAENGDINAMMALGRFYADFDNKKNLDLDKAIMWYTRSAEKGDVNGMYLAALLGNMNAHVLMKISPDTWQKVIPKLEESLYWAKQALGQGHPEADKQIIAAKSELGEAYMYGGMFNASEAEEMSVDYLMTALNYLKEVYQKTSTDESTFHLGTTLFYLNSYMQKRGKTLKKDDGKLMHKCLLDYTDNHNYTDKNVGMAYGFLGILYTFGFECKVNYNKAVEYYTIATEKCDFDCSQDLKHFKKRLFGGYTYIE